MSNATSIAVARTAPAGLHASDFLVRLLKQRDGPVLAREAVTEADLSDILSELWLEGWLRRGQPDAPLESLALEIVPEPGRGSSARCVSFTFRATDGRGRAVERSLPLEAFEDVAERAAERLLATGVLKADDTYFYEVAVARRAAGPADSADPLKITARRAPLAWRSLELKPLLDRATPVGPIDDAAMPIFYTLPALEKADQYARRGAVCQPPAETGAVLAGPLCSCPKTGEFFVVISDALELEGAEGSEFALSYSGTTWQRIQREIKARQIQAGTAAYRIVGQAHGHNYACGKADGACDGCRRAQNCPHSNVFASLDDRSWSRAVFHQQPWHVCQIFGRNGRGQELAALYGLRDNRLEHRGFHLLDDFT